MQFRRQINLSILMAMLLSSLLTIAPGHAAETCSAINMPSLADDSLTVTMLSMNVIEKPGSYQLTISYRLLNDTTDKKIDEGAFKIFYSDGSSEPQYGFFGTFFPGDSRDRTYTWEYLKSKSPMDISYNAGFFSSEPSSTKLNWALPGQNCTLVSAAAKAAADKLIADAAAKAAEEKAAADLKAKQDADAKAAADLKAKQDADAKAAADLKAKQEADAQAAADKAAADLKAAADKAKAAADAATAANLKAKQDKEAQAAADKAAAELKAKQDADAKAAAELKAKQDADAKAAADLKAAAEKAKADAAKIPVGDVACSLVDDGVRYGVSMTFGSASVTLGSLTYDWDYSLLGPTGNPALVSSYSARQFFKSTDVNGMNLTYKELLILAAGNIKATILIFVSPVNSVGNLVTRNTLGKGCYVELPTVLKNIEKATADKAAADLKAKQEADTKAAAEKLAADKALSDAKSALAKSQSDLRDANTAKAAAEAASKQAVSDKATVEANGKAALADLQTQLSSLNAKMAEMQLQIDSLTAKFNGSQKSLATVNAKLKKICAVKPKPKGC